ncbi:aspartyl protease family protein [Glacieibacterium megasporae]|uniref:aspartyl protease family protein n=1 Tax=Glacieibacterium megasporae TaxID=2835787 RepID=UPI001C1DEA6C|nr:aspartyl protease family protein [Polymorphobacter megasporae]UAJ09851.1 aspartyl protease family protein [Polymorphobacter megasporae]
MSIAMLAALAALSTNAAPPILPTIPPATIDETLEITGDAVAAEQSKTRMFIPVEVNGKGPYRFLVDSGADRSVIGSGLAAQLALPAGNIVKLQGMAGASRVGTVRIETIKLGQSVIDNIAAPALPERYLGAQGLVGIDALADQRLMLDFDKKTITVQDSRKPEMVSGGDEIVVTARRRNGQLILTAARVGNIPIYAVIDTGSEITMGNLALESRVFGTRRPPVPVPVILTSVTGQTLTANLATVANIHLGGIDLANVRVAFADAPPFRLFGLEHQPALLLGTDVLEAFRRVALDFRARRVRFTLRR